MPPTSFPVATPTLERESVRKRKECVPLSTNCFFPSDGWATVEVNSTTAYPTEGHDFGLVCTVTMSMNVDLNADPTLVWVGPDGTPVLSEHNITVGTPMVDDNVTSLTLLFTPLNSSHGGE